MAKEDLDKAQADKQATDKQEKEYESKYQDIDDKLSQKRRELRAADNEIR